MTPAMPPFEGAAARHLAGLAPLDLELALLAQELNPGIPDAEFWAVALASRAHACGHTAIDLRLTSAELTACVHPDDRESLPGWSRGLQKVWPLIQSLRARSGLLAGGLITIDREHLYLCRLWAAETRVLQAAHRRALPASFADGTRRVEPWLQRWLPSSTDAPADDQQQACLQALQRKLTVITGGPGTGKTYTAARLIALLQAAEGPNGQALRIGLAAPTGKAAARLQQAFQDAWSKLPSDDLSRALPPDASARIARATTLHRLLGRSWLQADHERAEEAPAPLPLDVLLIDEASMVDLQLADAVLRALPEEARLILIGDRHQLASVEAGSFLADLVEGLQPSGAVVSLSQSRRFAGGIAQWARTVLEGDLPAISALIQDSLSAEPPAGRTFDVQWLQAPSAFAGSGGPSAPSQLTTLALGPEGSEGLWATLRALDSSRWDESGIGAALAQLDRFRILCAVRQGRLGVEGCNEALETELAKRGWADPSQPWYHGRQVLINRNLPELGLNNGDVGVVIASPEGARLAWLEGSTVISVSCSRLGSVETAYAMTVHKSQGSEFDHVALVLPDSAGLAVSRELVYTGITRARKRLWLRADPAAVLRAAQGPLRRMGGLAGRLLLGESGRWSSKQPLDEA